MGVVSPKLLLTQSQWNEIKYYVAECPMEISGMGNVIIDKDGNFKVTKLAMLEQEVSGASTDIDPTAIAKLMGELRHEEGSLSFWWHSHVNMGAFFSGTDEATILEHGKNGYCIALVINKRGEYKLSYCQKTPFLKIDDVQLEIVSDASPERLELLKRLAELDKTENVANIAKWDAEYKTKVSVKTYNNYGNHGWDADSAWDSRRNMTFDADGFYVPHAEATQGNLLGIGRSEPKKRPMTEREIKKYKKLYKEFYGYEPLNPQELEEFFMDFYEIEEERFYGTKTSASNKAARLNTNRSFRKRN